MTGALVGAEAALQEATAERRVEAELAAADRSRHAPKSSPRRPRRATANPQEALADATAAAKEAAGIVVPALPRLMTDDVTPEVVRLADGRPRRPDRRPVGRRRRVRHPHRHPLLRRTQPRACSSKATPATRSRSTAKAASPNDRAARHDARSHHPTRHPSGPGRTTRIPRPGRPGPHPLQPPGQHRRQPQQHADPVPEPTETTYRDALQTLVLLLADHDTPHHLELTPEARQILLDFQDWIEPRLHPRTGQLAPITDWASKLAGHVVRIAALLHLAHTFTTGYAGPITADTMRAAERVGRYYLDHALAVYDLMGRSDPDLDDARDVLAWITKFCDRTGRDTFARRDALRGLQSNRFPTAEDLEPALKLLTEHGHIRPKAAEKTSKGGRPSAHLRGTPARPHDHRRGPMTQGGFVSFVSSVRPSRLRRRHQT